MSDDIKAAAERYAKHLKVVEEWKWNESPYWDGQQIQRWRYEADEKALAEWSVSSASELLRDADRLDGIESLMRPSIGYCEVYLAGLRIAGEDASAYQVELPGKTVSGPTLRAAIDAAIGISLKEPAP